MNFVILPHQLRLMLVLCYGGMAAGLWYDLMGILRRGALWLADMMFSLGACALYTLLMGALGETGIRPVTILFFCGGFLVYRQGIHALARGCINFLRSRKNAGERRSDT